MADPALDNDPIIDSAAGIDGDPAFDLAAAPDASETTYSLFAAFRVSSSRPVVLDGRDVPGIVRELEDVTREIEDEGVVLRGWYDLSGVRSDADLLVWLQGIAPEDLQWSLRQLRRTALVQPLIRTWGALGIVTGAASPGTVTLDPGDAGEPAVRQWVSVVTAARHPSSVRSADDVTVQVMAAHGTHDADWLVTHEADDLSCIVDHLRDAGADAGRLTAFAGRLVDPAEIVEVLQ